MKKDKVPLFRILTPSRMTKEWLYYSRSDLLSGLKGITTAVRSGESFTIEVI
jgi:hypothetical protein